MHLKQFQQLSVLPAKLSVFPKVVQHEKKVTFRGLQMLSKTWSSKADVLGMSGGRLLGDTASSTWPAAPFVASSPNRATSSSLSDARA